MFSRTHVCVVGAFLISGLIQGCGGGGGGNFSGFPTMATATDTSQPNGAAASPDATTPGGTAPMPSSPTVPFPIAPTVPNTASEAGAALGTGLYVVSWGIGSINGKEDKSIWRRVLQGQEDGLHVVRDMVYAGNDQGGNDALGDALRPLFEPSNVRRGTELTEVRFDDANSMLQVGSWTADGFRPLVNWQVSLEQSDIAGQLIQEYLAANSSLTKPFTEQNVSGNFAAGSKGYRIDYSSDSDIFLYMHTAFATSQAEFERTSACGSPSMSPRLAYRIQAGGVLRILEIEAKPGCTTLMLDAGVEIGTGTWTQKTSDRGISYTQIDFPAEISYERFDPTFRASEYAAGVRDVRLVSSNGEWQAGYVIPAGVHFRSKNLLLNKIGADSVKTAAGM
jgi:hypothetical protein